MDVDEHLIEEVRNHPLLYDLGNADYKNLKKKDYAWREVAANLKLNDSECRKRWKGLRDSYKRCKRMEQVASGSAAETPKRKWRFLEPMSFLDNVSSSRRTVGNVVIDHFDEEEFIEFSDLDSTIGCSPTASIYSATNSRSKKKEDSDKFQNFLDLAATSISETCTSYASQKKDSTALMFEGLATKIQEAHLPPNIINRIETKVLTLVYSEIEQYYSGLEKK